MRDDAALANLPDTEREAWRQLGADVAELLMKVRKKSNCSVVRRSRRLLALPRPNAEERAADCSHALDPAQGSNGLRLAGVLVRVLCLDGEIPRVATSVARVRKAEDDLEGARQSEATAMLKNSRLI